MRNTFTRVIVAAAVCFSSLHSKGQTISTVAGSGAAGFTGDGGYAAAASMDVPQGIVFDAAGNMYFADYNNNRVRKVNTAGLISTIAGNGTAGYSGDGGAATAAMLNNPTALAIDLSGNILVADQANQRIRKISTSGIITTVAGTGTSGYSGDGGAATAAQLFTPYGIATDASGNLYIADWGNSRIRRVDNAGNISTYAGNGSSGSTGDGGAATAAMLLTPRGVTADISGNVYFTEGDKIRVVNGSGIISTFAGTGASGFSGDGGAATAAQISGVYSIYADRLGNLYIADQGNNRVRVVNSSGNISTFAGNGTAGFSGDGGPATAAKLDGPWTLAKDGDGNFYVSDQNNNRIRKIGCPPPAISPITGTMNVCIGSTVTLGDITSGGAWSSGNTAIATVGSTGTVTGISAGNVVISYAVTSAGCTGYARALVAVGNLVITTIAGTGTVSGFSGDGGPATAAKLFNPESTFADPSTLETYICDNFNGSIRKISTAGIISTIAGTGTAGYSGDGGPATAAQFNRPFQMVKDGAGNLIVCDGFNHRVRKIDPAGIVTTIAGTGTSGFSGDGGSALSAQFNTPCGLAIDPAGNLYIGDYNNNRIRKIDPAGVITTYAGNGVATFAGDGGQATAASLRNPNFLRWDPNGTLLIVDNTNQRIRRISQAGIITTVAGNGISGGGGDGGQATAAQLSFPGGVAVDGAGNIYIAGDANQRIRVVNAATGIITTYAGTTTSGYLGDGGAATACRMNLPVDVSFDNSGNILVADQGNQVIRKIAPVNTALSAISGTSALCQGVPVLFTDATTGGTWSSSSSAIATVGSTTGIVTGVAAGTANITYTVNFTCGTQFAIFPVTVNAFSAGTITGSSTVCVGNTVSLSDGTPGGTWSSSNTAIGTVSSTGVVTGIAAGYTVISYSITNGCGTTAAKLLMTVGNPIITTIAGNGAGAYSGDGGAATAAALQGPTGSVMDGSGNIYFSDWTNNVVRKITPAGIITTIAGTGAAGYSGDGGAATAALLRNPSGIALDPAGNILFAEYNNSVIRKVSTSGIITTVAGNGSAGYFGDNGLATAAILNHPASVFVDATGNIYIPDAANHRIRKIDLSGTITTVAGSGVGAFSGDGGPATAARIANPFSVCLDLNGNLLIADQTNRRIRKVDQFGYISTILGTGVAGSSPDGTIATAAAINVPTGVTIDPAGNVVVVDRANNCVRKISAATGTISTIVNSSLTAGFSGDGGAPTAAQASGIPLVSFDAAGNLYVSDFGNNRIRKVQPVSNTVAAISGASGVCQGATTTLTDATPGGTWTSSNTAFATVGGTTGIVTGVSAGVVTISYTVTFACGPITMTKTLTVDPAAGYLYGPGSLCIGASVQLANAVPGGSWVSGTPAVATVGPTGLVTGVTNGGAIISYTVTNSCGTNVAVKSITVASVPVIQSIAGVGTAGYSGDGGPAINAAFSDPGSVSVDNNGNVYIADFNNNAVRRISSTGIITTLAGNGTAGFSGDDGPSTAALLSGPRGITAEPSGNIYFCDVNNHRVRMINTSGIITTVAGNGTAAFAGDGSAATAASLRSPMAVKFDNAGNMYIGDYFNYRIRKVNTSGIISTICGNGSSVYSGEGVPATAAQMGGTTCFEVDGAGNIYFGDNLNNRVRKINTAGIITTVAGTGTGGYSGDGGAATAAMVNGPMGVALDNWGNLYIADRINNRIRKVTPAGIISTYAGTGTSAFFDNVAATLGMISFPGSVDVDAAGNMFIGDAGNARVRAVWASCPCTGSPSAGTVNSTVSTGCSPYTSLLTLNGASGGPAISYQWQSSTDNVTFTDVPGATSFNYLASVASAVYYHCVITCTASALSATTPAVFLDEGLPVVAAIGGPSAVCPASTISLTDATAGGSWSSTSTAVATIGTSGTVTGVTAGTTTISYTVTNACGTTAATKTVSVTALSPITGTLTVCPTGTTTLSNLAGGGTWTSGSTSIATIGSSTGIVTGVAAGTANITYTTGAGCTATAVVTVNPLPSAIAPATPVSLCVGATASLSDPTPGGTWSSNASGTASVVGGTVTGVAAGVATISYTLGTGCYVTKDVTVNITPTALSPASAAVCIGATTVFTDAVTGGAWSSSASGTASVVSGTVTGVAAGTATISYTIGSCFVTAPVTVNANPSPITPAGPVAICVGATASLADATPGGSWSSSSTAIATVGSTGTVTGVASGTANISYTSSAGCSVTKTITVSVTPTAISPSATTVCTGTTVTLTNGVGGGVWTSSAPGIASVSGGVVTGVTVGTATITYTIGSCFATAAVTVNLSPDAGTISGPTTVCVGSPITLTDAAAGGAWSSSDASVATVGSTGIVSGASNGTVTISYTVTNGCGSVSATYPITVNTPAVAGTITGLSTICAGTFTVLVDTASGGVWSVTNSNATISGTGVLTGVTPGTDTVLYTVVNACGAISAMHIVTIGPYLSAGTISGASSMCEGTTITLADPAPGGAWSSSSTAIATVGSTGIVTGTGGGLAIISYTVTSGCGSAVATHVVNVTPIPNAGTISGPIVMCAGMTATYTDPAPGGIWGTTNPVVTITTGGFVTAVFTGTDTITYDVTNACGSATATIAVTIGPAISAGIISGPATVCEGASITLTDPATGGVWSASNTNATVSGGVVTGVSAGTVDISYTVTSTCGSVFAAQTVTVNPLPNAGAITGASSVCVGGTTTLADATPAGMWSASNSNATVGSTGIVTGVTAGAVTISYTVTNSCGSASATNPMVVSTTPSAGVITGPGNVCPGATITLADATPGGTWGASNSNATVTSGGIVAGVTAGLDTISYTVTSSCGTAVATSVIAVNALPAAGTITGTADVCVGSVTTLVDAAPGGTWAASNANATVAGGVVTGVMPGLDTITYTVTNICGTAIASAEVTVNPVPDAGTITGGSNVCTGSTLVLTDAAPGGAWSASNGNATVAGGMVTGVLPGLDTISYTVSNSCGIAIASVVVSIGTVPVAGAISGPATVCKTATIILAASAPGGVWSASNSRATVTSAGVVTGVTAGLDTIIYTVTNVCGSSTASRPITVMQAPSPGSISGPTSICAGLTASLSDPVAGGTWSTSNPTVATVSAAGVVSGNSAGSAIISYSVTNVCGTRSATHAVAVLSTADCNTLVNGPGAFIEELQVFPNPNQGIYSMRLVTGNEVPVTVVITNVIGKKVKEFTATSNKTIEIQMNTAPGIYVLTATTPNGKYVNKVTVE